MTDDLEVSKTKRKQAMNELQDLGEELVQLPASRIKQLDLPERLVDAINEARRLRAHEAVRRQMQYIGKLMRDVDPAPIQAQLAIWRGESKAEVARIHRIEQWRDRLLAEDAAFDGLVAEYPHLDRQLFRQIIRNARGEATRGKPPKHARMLFRELRVLLDPAAPRIPDERPEEE